MSLIIKQSVPLFIKIAVLMTSLYIVANNLPPLIRSFRYFWGPSVLLWIFLLCPSAFKINAMKYLILYGILSLGILQFTIWQYMRDWHQSQLLNEFYSILTFSAIFFFYYTRRDFKGLASVAKLGFYSILITIIMTNIALFLDPMIVRQAASPEGFTPFQARIFERTGAAGYGYAQALVCLIPVLVYYIKSNSEKTRFFSRKIMVLFLFMLLFTLVHAQVFANIFVAAVILIFSIAGLKRINRSIAIVTFLVIVILIIPKNYYADLFSSLSSFFDAESVLHDKLKDLAFFIRNPVVDLSTEAGLRTARYPYLFDKFISSPIWGGAALSQNVNLFLYEGSMWTHLYWMYRLALWGLPGFLFFVFVLFQLVKKIYTIFDSEFKFYYLLSVSAFILLGVLKNITGREPYLMLIVIVPGLYFLPRLKQKK